MPSRVEVDPIPLTIKSSGKVKINQYSSKGVLSDFLHSGLCEDEINISLLLVRSSHKGPYHSYLSFAVGEETPSLSPGPFPIF